MCVKHGFGLLSVLMGGHCMATQLIRRFTKFIFNVNSSSNEHILMCNKLCYFSNTAVAANKRKLLHLINLDDLSVYNISHLLMRIPTKRDDLNDASGNLLKELCLLRDGVSECFLTHTEIISLINYICCI